jgi:predicted acyltransferase
MFLVNYFGQFDSMPEQFKHHETSMTFADLIAPLFLFVVGMSFRLSMLRNVEAKGYKKALLTGLRRYAVLTLVGIIYYDPLNWNGWWDALVDIGLSGLLALPFIPLGVRFRVAAAAVYMIVYQIAYSLLGYGPWVMSHSYDGGPLGPLSWVFSLLLGTIAYDLIATRDGPRIVRGCLAWGLGLAMLGLALRIPLPGIKEYWFFTQKGMSAPYPIYATGLCFLMFIPFYFWCDVKNWNVPTLVVLGANPLVMYIVHSSYLDQHHTIISPQSGPLMACVGFAIFYAICYAVANYLYRHKIFVKI